VLWPQGLLAGMFFSVNVFEKENQAFFTTTNQIDLLFFYHTKSFQRHNRKPPQPSHTASAAKAY